MIMDSKRKKKLIFRWALVSTGAITLFWTIWYLINGSVPVVTEVKITEDWIYILPFGISRWWDVLAGPICSSLFILLVTNKRITENNNLVTGLGVGLFFGLGVGLSVGLVVSLGVGLIVGLGVGLAAGLAAGLVAYLVFGIKWLIANSK